MTRTFSNTPSNAPNEDAPIEDALATWAQETPQPSPSFMEALDQIPARHGQKHRSWGQHLLQACGGWRFAAPQLAGIAAAFVIGLSLGGTPGVVTTDEDFWGSDDFAYMTTHILGSEALGSEAGAFSLDGEEGGVF